MMVEGAVGLPVVELDNRLPLRSPKADMENSDIATPKDFWNEVDIEGAKNYEVDSNQSPSPNQLHQSKYHSELADMGNQRNLAALKLQKVYKSFRIRRQLADCAVVVEQRWWKVLDFAELKRSSISFFDIEKPESVQSRWSRARTRAAKVGKGLSKDQKARKLALQHWLEAIDPRHRYGHNLQFYYVAWLHCESYQPFFYWLDIGEGKELSLEICPRSKLHQQCIKYLGPTERQEYEVVVEDGKLIYKISGGLLDTSRGPKGTKWIFVLSTSKKLYVGMKMKGTFQHSSFLAGGATLSAGRLVVEDGILKSVWPHSGHYLPTEENFQEFVSFLNELNVDLTNVKKSPCEDEDEAISKKSSSLHNHFSEDKIIQDIEITEAETLLHEDTPLVTESVKESENPTTQATPRETSTPRLSLGLESKLASLEIPTRVGGEVIDINKSDIPRSTRSHHSESPFEDGYETARESSPIEDGYETAEETFLSEEDFMVAKKNLFDEDDEEVEEEKPIPKEKIMQRIDSHKGTRSYQLGQQLCSRWSTGAGPRIGCMRDYPSELRSRVLEQASLSPRAKVGSPRNRSPFGSPRNRSPFGSPKVTTPSCLGRVVGRSPLAPSPLGQSK